MSSGETRVMGVMLKTARGIFLTLTCVFPLIGCQAMAPVREADTEAGKEIFVKENLVGEECRVQSAAEPDLAELTEQRFNIFCGRWEHASARIFQVSPPPGAASLSEWAERGWWKQALDNRMRCQKPEPAELFPSAEALVLQCKLHNGGWPYMALAASVDDSTFLAEGIPAVFGVIGETIGVISGRTKAEADTTPGRIAAAIRRLEASLSGRLYGAGDLQTYYRLMTAGQYYDNIKDFPSAEKRYREALALHERLLGVGNSESLDVAMHLALELSNQQKFLEAEVLLDRVGRTERALDQTDYARYLSYRALHAGNQGNFDGALQFAREATALRRELLAEAAVSQASMIAAGQALLPVSVRADAEALLSAQSSNAADVVQSLYIEAAMLDRLGRSEEAQQVLRQARDTLLAADEAPPSWDLGFGSVGQQQD